MHIGNWQVQRSEQPIWLGVSQELCICSLCSQEATLHAPSDQTLLSSKRVEETGRRQGGSQCSPQRSGPAASNDLRCMPVYEELDNHASVHAAVQNVCWFMHVYVSARVSVSFIEKHDIPISSVIEWVCHLKKSRRAWEIKSHAICRHMYMHCIGAVPLNRFA